MLLPRRSIHEEAARRAFHCFMIRRNAGMTRTIVIELRDSTSQLMKKVTK